MEYNIGDKVRLVNTKEAKRRASSIVANYDLPYYTIEYKDHHYNGLVYKLVGGNWWYSDYLKPYSKLRRK